MTFLSPFGDYRQFAGAYLASNVPATGGAAPVGTAADN
jgi:hypothetical protein